MRRTPTDPREPVVHAVVTDERTVTVSRRAAKPPYR